MATRKHAQTRAVPLPSIAQSLAHLEKMEPLVAPLVEPAPAPVPVSRMQTSSETSNPQQSNSLFKQSSLETASFNGALPNPGNSLQNSTGGDQNGRAIRWQEHGPNFYCQSSANDSLLNQVDPESPTSSTSPLSGSTPRSSRASSVTSPSLANEFFDNMKCLAITSAHVQSAYQQVEKVFENTPATRASEPKNQHMLDERRRRAQVNGLFHVLRENSDPAMVRLKEPHSNCSQEGFSEEVVRAIVTGNHKPIYTKIAIMISHLVLSLRRGELISQLQEENGGLRDRLSSQASRIMSLEEENRHLREQISNRAKPVTGLEEEDGGLCDQVSNKRSQTPQKRSIQLNDMMENTGLSPASTGQQFNELPSQTTKRQRPLLAKECQKGIRV